MLSAWKASLWLVMLQLGQSLPGENSPFMNGVTTTGSALFSRERPDGVTETYVFDTQGRAVAMWERHGQTMRFGWRVGYDALGRIVLSQVGEGPVQRFAYRVTGQNVIVETQNGGACTTIRSFDPRSRELVCRDGTGWVRTTYDERGQITAVHREELGGLLHQFRSFEYDARGRLLAKSEPETGTTTYSAFNAFGQPGLVVDAKGRRIVQEFDPWGRLVSLAGGAERINVFYQGPLLVSRTCADGTTQSFTYTGGHLDSETLSLGDGPRTIRYGYDAQGEVDCISYPSGLVVGYSRDTLHRICAITLNGAPLASVDRDGWGNLSGLAFNSGARSTWQWDPEGRQRRAWTVTHGGGAETR